jgi:hypothetical protein
LARHDFRAGRVVGSCVRVAARRGIRDPGRIGTVDPGEDTLRRQRASRTWSSVDFSAFRADIEGAVCGGDKVRECKDGLTEEGCEGLRRCCTATGWAFETD